jgi:hypothetical protein
VCSLILLALNTYLATPACVTEDGPATVAAQHWSAYSVRADGYGAIEPAYAQTADTITAGAFAGWPNPYSTAPGVFVGFTWFADSMTLVIEDDRR